MKELPEVLANYDFCEMWMKTVVFRWWSRLID